MTPLVFASLWPRLVLVLVGLAGLGGGAWYLHHKGYESGKAKVEAKWKAATADAAGKFAQALQDQQVKLLAADKALTDIRRQTRTTRESLDDALDTPAGADWGNTAIPPDVLMPLRSSAHPPVPGDSHLPDPAVRDP